MQPNHADIVIIGAGIAGLACAQVLQQAGYQVAVIEKSRGVGGRMATRRLGDVRVDHGTCYVAPKGEQFRQFIHALVDRGVVQVWTDAVYELSAEGTLQPPAAQTARYVAADGMSAIAKCLAPQLDIRLSQRVTHLELRANQWHLTLTATGAEPECPQSTFTASAIVITTPAPQAVELLLPLQAVGVSPDFLAQVQAVEFSPCIAVMAGYTMDCLQDWQTRYGAVRAIAAHQPDIGWIGLDSSKRLITPQPVFVVQSSVEFAQTHLEAADLMPMGESLLQSTAALLAPWLAQPVWMQVHRWRYAFAQRPLAQPYLSATTSAPLLCAGDWCGGMRVESAMASGVEAAGALNQRLAQRSLSAAPFWQAIDPSN